MKLKIVDVNQTKWFTSYIDGSGHWGVAQGCNCRSILDAITALLEAQRPDLAMVVIEEELNPQT